MEIKGIDVSAWQGNIDWATVADYGMGFVILRITEKGNKTDSTFEQNYKGCTQHGIPVGVYKYSYAKSPAQAEQEAEAVLEVLNKRKLDFPVFYDLEWSEQRKLGSAAVEKIALSFLKKIQAAGYQAGIYCNVDWYQNVLTATLKKYDCWIARYPANDDGWLQERLRPDFGVGWQYSSKARIPGISGNVDRNVFYKDYNNEGEVESVSKIEKAVRQMEAWAKDDSHGYDQIFRWGEKGDFDCSAAVIQACQNAGIPVKTGGATYTGNMLSVFKKCGFKDITAQVNRSTGAGLIRGDVLLNTTHHTAMYCGDGKEVEASINEKGTATGGKPGDQTGREFLIRSYRNYPWTHVLRYVENTSSGNSDTSSGNNDTSIGGNYMFETQTVKAGSKGLSVLLLQEILIARGFRGKDGKTLDLDREAGTNTIHALKKYQESRKGVLEADGICGPKTWKDLIAL